MKKKKNEGDGKEKIDDGANDLCTNKTNSDKNCCTNLLLFKSSCTITKQYTHQQFLIDCCHAKLGFSFQFLPSIHIHQVLTQQYTLPLFLAIRRSLYHRQSCHLFADSFESSCHVLHVLVQPCEVTAHLVVSRL